VWAGRSATTVLVAGLSMGLFRLAGDTPVTLGVGADASGWLIFLVSVAAMVVVSLATAPPPDAPLAGLTCATVSREQRAESRRSWDGREVAASALVLVLITITYVYFTG
jgi:SSS family solute:Na+ symporter